MPTPTTSPSNGTTSGIITTPSGTRHIPSSVRPDGSTRKEIRIRPGYRPPEDVEVYKNRTAEAWKTRGAGGGVPGAEGLNDRAAGEEDGKAGAAAGKNAKRREARRKAKAAGKSEEGAEGVADGEGDAREAEKEAKKNAEKDAETRAPDAADAASDRDLEKEKKVRKLKKKLREARELQEKKEKGEGLLQEQFEKVIRINEIIRDLDRLGFNSDGEPKRD